MDPAPDIDPTTPVAGLWATLVPPGAWLGLEPLLLLAVVLVGAVARGALAAREIAAGAEGGRSMAAEEERRLTARLLWLLCFPPAFLLLSRLAQPPGRSAVYDLGAYLLIALLLLLTMDALPARLGHLFPGFFGRVMAPALRVLALPVLPVARHRATRRAREPHQEAAAADEELLLQRLIEATEDGDDGERSIDEGVRQLVGRVVRLRETRVGDVMQPRDAVVWLRQDESLQAATDLMLATGAARLAVVGRDLDDVLGILHLKDLFVALHLGGARAAPAAGRPALGGLARQAVFVREDLPLGALIAQWRRAGGSVSVVRGERGRVVGLIMLVDVLRWLMAGIEPGTEAAAPAPERGGGGGGGDPTA